MIYPIFLSHSSHDKELAEAIKEELDKELGANSVFVSERIESGEIWFSKVHENLKQCKIMVILLTKPASDSLWVGFEAGFVWDSLQSQERIHILRHPNVKALPSPIDRIHAKYVNDSIHLQEFFQKLCEQFGKKEFESKANIYRITSLAQSTIPLYPDRSILRFGEYLADIKEWDKIEEETIESWIYSKDVLYQIIVDHHEDESSTNKIGKWDFRPNEEKPTQFSKIRLKISGITVEKVSFVYSEWFFVPLPEFEFIDGQEIFYWDENSLYFKVGLVIGSMYCPKDKCNLYDFALQRNIQIR